MSECPRWFRPVAVGALLWNAMGCAAYVADVSISAQRLAEMSTAQQALYTARPSWAVAATAVAVWFGALGSVGLIMRRQWATILLMASLAGVVVQDLWLFALSGVGSEAAASAGILQGLVLAAAIALVALSRRASSEAWLS